MSGGDKMSFFDGIIPQCCAKCFEFQDGHWRHKDPGLCDECDCAMVMFPLLPPGFATAHDALDWVQNAEEPVWRKEEMDGL